MNDPPHSTFPPILAARRITSPAHPFDAAVEGAGRGELRAADALWSDAGGRAELAIVLEPEVAVEISREIAAVMFLAVADSLGALLPPQSSVFLRWPNTILLNVLQHPPRVEHFQVLIVSRLHAGGASLQVDCGVLQYFTRPGKRTIPPGARH